MMKLLEGVFIGCVKKRDAYHNIWGWIKSPIVANLNLNHIFPFPISI